MRLVSLSQAVALFALLAVACSKSDDGARGAPTATSAPKPEAATKPVAVRIGYQKIGSPFLLKERADGLNAALKESGAHLDPDPVPLAQHVGEALDALRPHLEAEPLEIFSPPQGDRTHELQAVARHQQRVLPRLHASL